MAGWTLAEISADVDTFTRLHTRKLFEHSIRREKLRNHIVYLYGEEMYRRLRRLDKLRSSRVRLQCALSFLLKCRDNSVVPTFAKVVHHINSPAASRIKQRAGLALVRERIHYTRRQLDFVSKELFRLHLSIACEISEFTWDWLDGASWSQSEWEFETVTARHSAKFERFCSSESDFITRRSVINLTEKTFDDAALSVLGKGLNFAPTPKRLPVIDFISSIEQAVFKLPSDTAEEVRREACRVLTRARPPVSNITTAEAAALRSLRVDSDIVILPADKGNATVVLNKQDYVHKMQDLLSDSAYRRIAADPTKSVERKTNNLLKKSTLSQETIKSLNSYCAVPPRLYGLPKVHKEGVPLRPIVSNIGAPTYRVAKHLAGLLSPLVGRCEHHIKNSADFLRRLEGLHLNDSDILVSFDVVSLFTRVPLADSLQLIEARFGTELTNLFRHVLTSTYFLFNDQYYEQTDGVAMGSPLSPIIANLFMEDFEERALESAALKPVCFYRYVDDTFVVWPHGSENLNNFLEHLNSIHPNIRFTMEVEKNGCLPFLDVLVRRKVDGTLGHAVYRKPTHTDLYMQADSCHHPAQREGVLRTLVHRAHVISDPESLSTELSHLEVTFRQNGYSEGQIKRALHYRPNVQRPNDDSTEVAPKSMAFLPYVGSISNKIGRILRKHDVKCVFRPPSKIKALLGSVKDDLGLRKAGVYRIPCSCGMSYIGQTIRTVEDRCIEHKRHTRLQQPSKSAIAEHCLDTGHPMEYNNTKILACTSGYWDCVIKEAIEIKLADNLMNRDGGYCLNSAWNPALSLVRKQRDKIVSSPVGN